MRSPSLGRVRVTLWGVAGAVALASDAYLLLHALCGDCLAAVAQANHVAHWVTLAGALAIPAGLLGRRWLVAALGMPGALAFGWWYGPLLWPPNIDAPPQAETFTIATYNVEREFTDPADVLEVILALDADIIALQEAPDALRRAPELIARYPHRAYAKPSLDEQLHLLSRFPILRVEVPPVDEVRLPDGKYQTRYLRAEMLIYGQRIAVYNFHPNRPRFTPLLRYDNGANQAAFDRMLTLLDAETLPTLVLCDCNTTPRTPQYHAFDALLDEAFAQAGWGLGLTHPGLPQLRGMFVLNMRIDYVWYSAAFRALAADVWHTSAGSDHRPLWARLALLDVQR
ncbi:MAG: endonuclease/exonuclease/phosphatase family protein [Anaerolineales bacterium]